MNHNQVPQVIAKELPLLIFAVKKTWVFLNIEAAAPPAVGFRDSGNRLKCWTETGAFFGGILGIFCGYLFSFTTSLGSLPLNEMLMDWIFMGLIGATAVGGLGALGAGFYNPNILPGGFATSKTTLEHSSKRGNAAQRGIIALRRGLRFLPSLPCRPLMISHPRPIKT